MTTITDPNPSPPTVGRKPEVAPDRMPPAVRWSLALALAGMMASALYLAVVRGEALLLDLASLGRGLWCF